MDQLPRSHDTHTTHVTRRTAHVTRHTTQVTRHTFLRWSGSCVVRYMLTALYARSKLHATAYSISAHNTTNNLYMSIK